MVRRECTTCDTSCHHPDWRACLCLAAFALPTWTNTPLALKRNRAICSPVSYSWAIFSAVFLIDGTSRDAVHVGLHHNGIKRLVDAAAGLQDAREEASLSELRDAEADIVGLGGRDSGPVTVALVCA